MATQTNQTIPQGWEETTLGEVAEIIMGQSPMGETCNKDSEGLPLLNGPTEFGSSYPLAVQFTTDARKLARTGDLLFCVRGSTTGRMNWADRSYAIGRGIAAIRHNEGEEYQPYLKAIMDYHLPVLLAQATGSTFPNVAFSQLAELDCKLPLLKEQRGIAAVLSSLDDKIELLRKQNKTLENIAQTLFKRWFVDFEFPNEKGKPYKSSGGKMIDSELGAIPGGWRAGKLQEIVNHVKINIKPFASSDKIFLHYSIPAFDKNKISESSLGRSILSNKYLVINDCLLVSKLNPKTPRIWAIFNAPENAICSTEFQVIPITKWF